MATAPAQEETKKAPKNGSEAMTKADQDAAALQKKLDGMTSVVNRVEKFYSPELEIPVGKDTFKKERCSFFGVPIELRERPADPKEPQRGRQFYLVVQVTTMPVKCRDAEKNVIEAVPGDYLWVDVRYDLRPLVYGLPNRKDQCGFEFYVSPQQKIDLKGGHSLWKFDVRTTRLSARELLDIGINIHNMLPPAIAIKELSQTNTRDESENDIPF